MSSPVEEKVRRTNSESDTEHHEYDPHYEPIVSLPLVEVRSNEEEEEELVKIRARLYRYDVIDHEWKERGTGDIKLLRHTVNNTVRVVMRRDKTLKVCANHFITPDIRMNIHCGSDKAFNWSVFADFADETLRQELLAIKFGNIQNAELWKSKFAEAQEIVRTKCPLYTQEHFTDDDDDEDDDDNDESSITRSENDTPVKDLDRDSEDLALEIKKLNVENEKSD